MTTLVGVQGNGWCVLGSESRASLDTGRLRIEVSHYITSIEEEEEFLKGNLGDSFALIEEVAKHLRKHGKEHIRQIPFSAVWDAFWYT